jgi:hypothetical protein
VVWGVVVEYLWSGNEGTRFPLFFYPGTWIRAESSTFHLPYHGAEWFTFLFYSFHFILGRENAEDLCIYY